MENPDTWDEAEKIISQALRDADKAHFQGVIGLSTPRQITDALREADLLVSEQLQARAQMTDVYSQQNHDLHRENMMLRDENAALRERMN